LQAGLDRVCTSTVVAAEQYYGAAKKRSTSLARRVDQALAMIAVLPWAHPADRTYGELRANLERRGTLVSANDMLIAAHALALGCTLVTDDRDYERIDGLRRESWL
jgi:tRNA(fMet)-specific endonuclease VapC